MKTKIQVNFSREENNSLVAKITIVLPTESDGTLSRLFRNDHERVLENKLTPEWGILKDGYRWGTYYLSDVSSESLKKRTKSYIESELSTLRRVKERNEKLLAESVPEDYEFETEI